MKKKRDGRWISDRRGRRVRLLDPMKLRLLHRNDLIARHDLDRMLNELEPGLARRLTWFVLPLVLSIVVMVGMYWLLWAISGQNFRASLAKVVTGNPGIYLPILVAAVIGPLATVRKHRARVPGLMLEHKRCPACAYDLRGLPTAREDGATICPECASAWDLDAAAQVRGNVADPPRAETPATLKIGIAAAALLAVVLIAVIFYGPVSRGGATPAATSLMVTGVIVGLMIVVSMLLMWKRGLDQR